MASFKDWIKQNILDKTSVDEFITDSAKRYWQGRVIQPAQEATRLRESGETKTPLGKLSYGANILGSAFALTPLGLGFNTAESVITSMLQTARRSKPNEPAFGGYSTLLNSFKRNLGTYDSGIFSQGLGVPGIVGLAGDVLLDPASAPDTIRAIRKLPSFVTGAASVADILKKRNVADIGKTLIKKEYPKPPKAVEFDQNILKQTLKNPKSQDLANTIHKAFSLQGMSTFDAQKSQGAIPYYIKRLGDKTVKQIYDANLKYPKSKSITSFWNDIQEAANKKGITIWEEANQSLAPGSIPVTKKDIIEMRRKGYSPSEIKDIVKKGSMAVPEPKDIYADIDFLPEEPKKVSKILKEATEFDPIKSGESIRKTAPTFKTKEAFDESLKLHTQAILDKHATLRDVFKLIDETDGMAGKKHFADIIQNGVKPKDENYELARELWLNYADDMVKMEGLKDINKVRQGYFAAISNDQVYSELINDLFPESKITAGIFDLPHLERKTNPNYIGSSTLVDTLDFRTKAGVLNTHKSAPISVRFDNKSVEKLAKHLENESSKSFDYVETFKPKKTKPIEVKTKFFVIDDKIARTDASAMRKLFVQNKLPALETAWKNLRDSTSIYYRTLDVAKDFVKRKDSKGLVNLFMETLQIKPELQKKFIIRSDQIIRHVGLGEYARMFLKRGLREMPIDEFIKESSKINFTDPNTKRFINELIDSHVKHIKWEESLANRIAGGAVDMFSRAHIGGNLKTAVSQLFDTTKLPFLYGLKDTAIGFKDAVMKGSVLDAKYGLGDLTSNYSKLRNNAKRTMTQSAFDALDYILFTPLERMERLKNRVFVATAESNAIRKGFSGDILVTSVLDDLNQYGAIANRYNTPNFMRKNSISRALTQYMQYGFKNFMMKADAVQEKEYIKLFKLLAADTANIGLQMALFGVPLKWAIGQLSPVSSPPLVDVIRNTYDATNEYLTAKREGKDTEKYEKKLAKLGITNIIPGGVQGYRTFDYLSDIQRGYAQDPSGDVKYPSTKSVTEMLYGSAFGRSTTQSDRKYYSNNERALGESDSDIFRSFLETDPEMATKFWQNVMDERDRDNMQDQYKEQALASATAGQVIPMTNQTVNKSKTAVSMYDILQRDAQLEKARSFITGVMNGTETGTETLTPEQKVMFIKNMGYTQSDITDWEAWKMETLPVESKADLIQGMDMVDFKGLYDNKVVTKAVLEELEDRGFIQNADSLWKKLQATDPKVIAENRIKLAQDLAKVQAETKKKMIKAEIDYRNKSMRLMLKKKSYPKLKMSKLSKVTLKVPKAEPYKPYEFPKL